MRLIQAQQRREDYKIIPVVPNGSWLQKALQEKGIPHEVAKFRHGLFRFLDKKTPKVLAQIIKKHRPDIIQNWAGPGSMHIPQTTCPQVARVGISMPPRYTRGAELIACTTKGVCDFLQRKGVRAENIRQIPALINIPPKGFEDFRYDVRTEYNIPHEAHVVLLLGRLQEGKGFDVALFALNMLPESVHVLIVGEGSEYAGLRDAVEADGLQKRVHFAGWIDNLTPIFAAADSFLLPSRRQSSCNVILEAWAHKLPVIATDIESVHALTTDGKNAILIPPEDDVAMANAVNKLLSTPKLASTLARAGYEEVCETFSEPAIVQAYDKLYRNAIAQHKPPAKPKA